MTREELDAKLDRLYQKSDEVKAKIKDARAGAKCELQDKLGSVRGDAEAAKETLRESAETGKSKVGAEMLKLQMTAEKIKDDIKNEFENAKDELSQKRSAKLVEALEAYAADAVDVALCAMDEAVSAVYEAAAARADYEDRYGA